MSFSYRRLSGFLDDRYEGQDLSGRFDSRPQFPEIEVTDEPTVDPVTLSDMKNEMRVSHDEDDDLISGYIKQATQDVEEYTGRSIFTQELTVYWKLAWDYVWLPRPPHASITSVTEIDDDGNEITITSDDYELFGRKEYKIEFDTTVDNQLRVVYDAGYGATVNDIPQWAKSAVQWQTKLYYKRDAELAIDSQSGLAMPAYLAAKNHQYQLPE